MIKKFMKILLILIVFSIFGYTWYQTITSIDKQNEDTKANLNNIVDELERDLNKKVNKTLNYLDYFGKNYDYEIVNSGSKKLNDELYSLLKNNTEFRDIAFVDKFGRELLKFTNNGEIIQVGRNKLRIWHDQSFVSVSQQLHKNEYFVSNLYGSSDGDYFIVFTKPVFSKTNHYIGFLMITYNINDLFESVDTFVKGDHEIKIISNLTENYIYKKDVTPDDYTQKYIEEKKTFNVLGNGYFKTQDMFGLDRHVNFAFSRDNCEIKGNFDFTYSIRSMTKLYGLPVGDIILTDLIKTPMFILDGIILLSVILTSIIGSNGNKNKKDKKVKSKKGKGKKGKGKKGKKDKEKKVKEDKQDNQPETKENPDYEPSKAGDSEFLQIICKLVRYVEDSSDDREGTSSGLHIYRVAEYSKYIALKLGLNPEQVNTIHKFAALHDIGKINVPSEILNKRGKLTPQEFQEIRKHVEHGYRLIKENKIGTVAENIVRYHHERWDGKGYMLGLSGKDIPIEARIVAIADTYDSVRGDKLYRVGYSHDKAMDILKRERGKQFDPEIVDLVIRENKYFEDVFESFQQ